MTVSEEHNEAESEERARILCGTCWSLCEVVSAEDA